MTQSGGSGPATPGRPVPQTVPARVFITGASGFIGRALALRYREIGSQVSWVDVEDDRENSVVAGNIAELGSWKDHLTGSDLVIHTAAVVSNTASADEFWNTNILGVRNVISAAVMGGASRFVNFSSVRAFSDVDFPDNVTETFPVRTDGHRYVDTKIAGEQVALQAHAAGEIGVTIIRPSDVYRPGSRPWTIIPIQMMRRRRFVLPDRGRGIFSPVYVDNLVDGVVLGASASAAVGNIFTIGDGVAVSCAQFFGYYSQMLGLGKVPTVPTPVARKLADFAGWIDRRAGRPTEATSEAIDYMVRRGTYSIEKARNILGYTPLVDLAEGMKRVELWLKTSGLVASSRKEAK